ncbi:MAG: ATP-binding cassette domain-containing protein, partial [Muribaculaceae bacterium]|nr:ATP-binding cassette domain-containing protein [Muribaculaceae bacterium]
MEIVRLEDVSVDFDGKWPLRNVNFELQRDEFVVLAGPNGSGKTTLLRVLLKLLRPTYGKVEYFNREGKPTKHLSIGYLPQKNNIDTRFPISVKETILSGLRSGWMGRLPGDAAERLDEVVGICGVCDYMHQPIGTLSGGQLQRALLARAIIGRPELLVLDEPLSYVDKQFEHRRYQLHEKMSHKTTLLLFRHEL